MSGELFPPRPGGIVDSTRRAAQTAQESAPAGSVTDYDGTSYDPVRVQLRTPEVATSGTVVVATTGTQMMRVVGEDGQRYRATLLTLDQPVIVCFSQAAASDSRNAANAAGQSAGGFVLPVNVPLTLDTSAEIWVAATSSTATRVSFIRQSFAG